jgi:hypothetical protein
MALTLLVALFLGGFLYRLIYKDIQVERVAVISFSFIFLFTVTLICYWMYAMFSERVTVFEFVVQPIWQAFLDPKLGYTGPTYSFGHEFDITTTVLWQLGNIFFIFLGVLGALIWLSEKQTSLLRGSIVFALAVVALIVYGNLILGLVDIRPTRWGPLLVLLLSLCSAVSVVALMQIANRDIFKIALLIPLILLISFFNITSPLINNDSPLYAEKRTSDVHLRESDMQASQSLAIHGGAENTLVCDLLYNTFIYPDGPAAIFHNTEILNPDKDYIRTRSIIVLRHDVKISIGKRDIEKLTITDEVIERFYQKYNLIYVAGNFHAFKP